MLAPAVFAADDIEKIVAEARRAFESGRFREASAKYLQAADAAGLSPDRVADLSLQAAWASYIDGDSAAARSALRKAYTARPELEVLPEFYSEDFARLASSVRAQAAPAPKIDTDELKRSARERLDAGMAQEVLYDLRQVSDSKDPEVHQLMAQALDKLGKPEEAEAERKKALALQSGEIVQSPIGALPAPPPPVAPSPTGPALDYAALLSAADAALGKSDWKGAEDLARRALEANARTTSAHRILGDAALGQNDAAAAEREYLAAIAIDPLDARAELGLAKIADRAHQPNTAAAHYKRALEIDSKSLTAALGLGEALAAAGDRSGARQAFGQATEIDPSSAAARDRFSAFLLANGEIGAAIDQGVEAVKLDMTVPAYRAHLGMAYLAAKMFKEADRELSEAARLEPGNAGYWDALGEVRMRSNDPARAADAYSRAASLAPDDETAVTGLAAALAEFGRWGEAEAVLRKAASESLPNSAAVANDLGVVEISMRRFDEAVRSFERATKLSPSSQDYAASLERARQMLAFERAALTPAPPPGQ
jgi:tetratricopeptide (TPR) repeat protein